MGCKEMRNKEKGGKKKEKTKSDVEEIEGSSPKHSETWLHDRRNDSWRNGTCRKHPLCPLLKESQRGWHYLPLGDAPFLPTSPSQPSRVLTSLPHGLFRACSLRGIWSVKDGCLRSVREGGRASPPMWSLSGAGQRK